ncbi:MAG: hypothetical protein ACK6DT_06655 [Planctomycetota bacterium]
MRRLCFLRAAKERSALGSGRAIGRVFFLVLSFGYVPHPVDLLRPALARRLPGSLRHGTRAGRRGLS